MNKFKYICVSCYASFRCIKTKLVVLFSLVLSLASCEKALEIYIGFPLQPTNINSVYEPGLNVFGVLKAGDTMDTINHYFEVLNIPHVFDTTSDIAVYNAQITLVRNTDTLTLSQNDDGLYYNYEIVPVPGDTWGYSCVYDTFNITSATTIPNMPVVDPNSISRSNGSLNFTIDYDSSAFMYDVYYIDEYSFVKKRFVPDNSTDIEVRLDIDYNELSAINLLYVFAYDKNYERYITTSNIFFKPNAFRPRFTTVNGGYGCFGSLSSLQVDLKKSVLF